MAVARFGFLARKGMHIHTIAWSFPDFSAEGLPNNLLPEAIAQALAGGLGNGLAMN